MKKALILIVVLLIPMAGLWAGGADEGGTAVAGGGEEYHFILVNNMATWSHFFPDYSAAQLACDEISAITGDKVTFEVVGPAENDLLKVVEAMESAIAKRPDGFMAICWDPTIMKAPIDKAISQGIPVVTLDADSPDSGRSASAELLGKVTPSVLYMACPFCKPSENRRFIVPVNNS